jgi:hypothetical protein
MDHQQLESLPVVDVVTTRHAASKTEEWRFSRHSFFLRIRPEYQTLRTKTIGSRYTYRQGDRVCKYLYGQLNLQP